MEWVRNYYHKKAAPSSLTAIFSWVLGGIHNIFSGLPFYWWRGDLVLFKKLRQRPPSLRGSWRAPNQGFFPLGAKPKSKEATEASNSFHSELENFEFYFLNRNASTKLPFHIDRRGMNFVNIFLAFLLILIFSSLLRVLFFVCFWPSPKTPAYPACAFGAPTHSITCLWLQPFPEKEETRESSAPVHVTKRTSLGPEFCEPPGLDQDLHYVYDISIRRTDFQL